jgi:hypothetical protein
MSQSDYIKLKRIVQVLKNDDLRPILDTKDYTNFSSYNLETTIKNTKIVFSRLVVEPNIEIFDMEKDVSNCAIFPLCINTNNRTNRVLNTTSIPTPLNKFKKNFIPKTCTFALQNGNVTRKVSCNKNICKCKTRIYE